MKRLMISPSFLSAQRWFFKKKIHQRLNILLSFFFCTFLSVSKFDFAVGRENFYYFLHPVSFFPTCNWSQPDLRSILTRSPCFVSWKFLILLMQTEMLSSAVHHALGSRGWAGQLSLFFYIYIFIFFFNPSPRFWKKKKKRQEKSIKSMNGFSSKTRAFKGETERESDGYRGGCGGAMFWWRFWE